MKKLFIPLLSFFSIFAALSANAQKVTLEYKGGNGYSLVERTNLRRYENGKYIGLTSREVHSFISPASPMNAAGSNSRWYDGNFYVIEDTLKNRKETSRDLFQRRQWHPTPVLLPGESHGRRSLLGCSP